MFPIKRKPKHRFLYNLLTGKKTYTCTQKTSCQVLYVHVKYKVKLEY